MIYFSKLQEVTLKKVDDMMNKGLDYQEIYHQLSQEKYRFRVQKKNGRYNYNHLMIYKNDEYSFVDLIKRKNEVTWETINLK